MKKDLLKSKIPMALKKKKKAEAKREEKTAEAEAKQEEKTAEAEAEQEEKAGEAEAKQEEKAVEAEAKQEEKAVEAEAKHQEETGETAAKHEEEKGESEAKHEGHLKVGDKVRLAYEDLLHKQKFGFEGVVKEAKGEVTDVLFEKMLRAVEVPTKLLVRTPTPEALRNPSL